ncbi:MAG: DNA methyltransferase [Anaerolineales bacterium]
MADFLIYADHVTLSNWNKSFVHECLQSLGFRIEKQSDNLALLKRHGEDDSTIGVCVSALPSENLDNTSMGSNYAFEVIAGLNHNGLKWGILTNGNRWRIYHTEESTPYENYLEIDLQKILDSKDLSSFQLLFFFLQAENFVVKDGQCRFDIFKTESQDKIAYIEAELKKSLKQKDEGGQGVLSDICFGYVEYLRSKGISDFSDDKVRETIYGGALFYMFRLLFIFYAQARELLHELELEEIDFILTKIRQYKDNNAARKDRFELWHSFNRIFSEINDIYNGGLFNPDENKYTKFIDDTRIADCFLAEPLFNLLHYKEKNKEIKPISYRDMNVRHLGTLYEGLLEHKLFIAEEDTEVRIVKKVIEFIPQSQGGKIILGKYIPAGHVYFGNDKGTRKASGSYYTPEYIVEYMVSNTVDVKLKELEFRFDESIRKYKNDLKIALNDSEKQGIGLLIKQKLVAFVENEILNFSVLDPAMGSGHFLVNATNHISNFITRFMNGYAILDSNTNTGTNLWRRCIVEHCIYGVDLNVLATELAKLSLWILTMAKDKPLSFLNHNLKIGNSVIGARLEDLGNYPFSKNELEKHNLFTSDENFRLAVDKAMRELELLRSLQSEKKGDIQEKQKHLKVIDELLQPYKELCDFQTSLNFGNIISEIEYDGIMASKSFPNHTYDSNWFHWELEFPIVTILNHGFQVIIGNPPFVFVDDISKYKTQIKYVLSTKNLFSYFSEVMISILANNGYHSFIVPLAGFSMVEMLPYQLMLIDFSDKLVCTNFSWRPGKVFENANLPVSIFLSRKNKSETKKIQFTSNYLRWNTGDEVNLMNSIEHIDSTKYFDKFPGYFPKIGSQKEKDILEKLFTFSPLQSFLKQKGSIPKINMDDYQRKRFYYRSKGGLYYKIFTNFSCGSTNEIELFTINDEFLFPILAILNSNLFFWFYDTFSSNRVLTFSNIASFPFDFDQCSNDRLQQLQSLGIMLMTDFKKNAQVESRQYAGFGNKECYTIYARKSKPMINEIDLILGLYFGFDDSETQFIINYANKYRQNSDDE